MHTNTQTPARIHASICPSNNPYPRSPTNTRARARTRTHTYSDAFVDALIVPGPHRDTPPMLGTAGPRSLDGIGSANDSGDGGEVGGARGRRGTGGSNGSGGWQLQIAVPGDKGYSPGPGPAAAWTAAHPMGWRLVSSKEHFDCISPKKRPTPGGSGSSPQGSGGAAGAGTGAGADPPTGSYVGSSTASSLSRPTPASITPHHPSGAGGAGHKARLWGGRRSEADAGGLAGGSEAIAAAAAGGGTPRETPPTPATPASLFGRLISGLAGGGGGNRVRDDWRASFRGGHSMDIQRTASAQAKAAAAAESPHEYRCWRSYVLAPDYPPALSGASLPDARDGNPADAGSAGGNGSGPGQQGRRESRGGDEEVVFDRFSLV